MTCSCTHLNNETVTLPKHGKNAFQPVKNLVELFEIWHQRLEERKQLARLDERLLRDMGLTQFEADKEINKPFWLE